jgi:NTP pyrophosphatase (non-canonical NTP hydrolase)
MNKQTDREVTLQQLKDVVAQFSKERNWGKHHAPKNLAMNIAIEAAELMEHYVWERDGEPDKAEVADELADIVFNCLNFAVGQDIDIATAFMDKFERLQKKYPTTIFNESNDSLDDYQKIKQRYRAGQTNDATDTQP